MMIIISNGIDRKDAIYLKPNAHYIWNIKWYDFMALLNQAKSIIAIH